MNKKDPILFIGRFQPLHKGHKSAIEKLRENYILKIIIGSSESRRTRENPLSYAERRQVIENCFTSLDIGGMRDLPSDHKWAREIIERNDFDVVVSGNSRVQEIFGKYEVEVKEPDLYSPEKYSGEIIREKIRNDVKWRHLVPECSLEILEKLNFSEIVKSRS